MEIKDALQELEALQKKLYAYTAASSSLYFDGLTAAPSDTAQGRGMALGILAGEQQKLMTARETGELLHFLSERKEELSVQQQRQVEILWRDYQKLLRIPKQEYMEFAMITNEATDIWHKAKEQNDFAMYQPILEKVVAYLRKFAGYYSPDKKPYDALLNEFERGVDTEFLDGFFGILRERIVPLLRQIREKEPIDDSFLHKTYPIAAQKSFSDYLMHVMEIDRTHCSITESEHPFTLGFHNKDVRITTNYKENDVSSSMYSVIHEGGHALYELGVRDEYQYTCLSGGSSMGMHESQSRFYENIIGRSRAFIQLIFPKMQGLFPEQLKDVTAEQMYLAVNKVQASFIRTEADELTYCLHIMVRYEIEKQLIGGSMEVGDIPEVWNRLYREYLGVDVPDDRQGCLQDIHWCESFGYFPSYALGNAYGAQMLQNMEKELDVWENVRNGNLSAITSWLRQKVHQHGNFLEPGQIVQLACGDFDPTVYVNYLVKKYTEIYKL